jgi:hypothetical protein
LAAASAYIAERWQGDEYRDGPASFHTDYCTYQCHGFTLADARPAPAPQCSRVTDSRRCTADDCDAGAHCRGCGGHFLDYHNSALRGCLCDSCSYDPANDEDGRGINGPAAQWQAGAEAHWPHWSSPEADGPTY